MGTWRSGSALRSHRRGRWSDPSSAHKGTIKLQTMKKILIIFLLWFFIINIFAVFSLNRFNLKGDTAYTWINPDNFSQNQGWESVSTHARWDSFWYLDVAKNGYIFKGPGELSNIVFFPLYPFLIKVISLLTAGNLILSGWLISSFFLLLASFYLFKLVKEFHPGIDPYLPVMLLLIFPTAFFLNAVYTESLFLFLSLATFYYSLKKNFLLAGIFGLLSSLTRATGILLFIPIFWEYLKNCNFNIVRLFNRNFLPILLMPAGALSFLTYHYLKFNDFLLFFKVESWWGRMFKLNKDHFLLISDPAIVNFSLDIFFIVLSLLSVYFLFKQLRVSYGLYVLLTLIVALSTGTFMSVGRYILVLFPIYILLASVKNQYFRQAWVFTSILLLAMYTILFVNNYWAG